MASAINVTRKETSASTADGQPSGTDDPMVKLADYVGQLPGSALADLIILFFSRLIFSERKAVIVDAVMRLVKREGDTTMRQFTRSGLVPLRELEAFLALPPGEIPPAEIKGMVPILCVHSTTVGNAACVGAAAGLGEAHDDDLTNKTVAVYVGIHYDAAIRWIHHCTAEVQRQCDTAANAVKHGVGEGADDSGNVKCQSCGWMGRPVAGKGKQTAVVLCGACGSEVGQHGSAAQSWSAYDVRRVQMSLDVLRVMLSIPLVYTTTGALCSSEYILTSKEHSAFQLLRSAHSLRYNDPSLTVGNPYARTNVTAARETIEALLEQQAGGTKQAKVSKKGKGDKATKNLHAYRIRDDGTAEGDRAVMRLVGRRAVQSAKPTKFKTGLKRQRQTMLDFVLGDDAEGAGEEDGETTVPPQPIGDASSDALDWHVFCPRRTTDGATDASPVFCGCLAGVDATTSYNFAPGLIAAHDVVRPATEELDEEFISVMPRWNHTNGVLD